MDASASLYPERPGMPDCTYYLRTGGCGFGVNCRFNHPPDKKAAVPPASIKDELPVRVGRPECQNYLTTGTCRFGSSCKFHHPCEKVTSIDEEVECNVLGLPMRLDQKECLYYMRTGSCKYGLTCKFHHPEPTPAGTLVPYPCFPFYAAPGTPASHVPIPYQAGVSSISVQGSPYISGSYVQGFPSYVPIVVSSCQTAIPGWNTYQTPISPSSSLEGWQPERINNENVQRQIEPKPAASGISSSQGDEELQFPERPGKQDCQFYMKTGSCKFGGSCKFHHPKERKAQAALCMLNVVGLPLRMGQPHCAFYMRYGICKFGPTCKYDHPVIYNSPTSSHYDIAVNSRPRITSPISILASKSSSEASQEVSKLHDVALEANTQVIQESEEVNSAVASDF